MAQDVHAFYGCLTVFVSIHVSDAQTFSREGPPQNYMNLATDPHLKTFISMDPPRSKL